MVRGAAAPQLPDLPDETVIAVFDDGGKFTMGDFKSLTRALPQQNQQIATMNPKSFIHWWAGMRKIARLAELEKLDQQSPVREQLAYDKTMILGQAKMNNTINTMQVESGDVAKSYEANKEKYKQVRVKALYISFGDAAPAGKKPLTENEAKDKAAKLLAQIRGGADFVKLVKENSDDVTSREKDGDFATLHPKDNVPDAIPAAVFPLKKGGVSEPVRQPNGYYLLLADEVTYRALAEVQTEIVMETPQERYNKWLGEMNDAAKVEFPSAAFPTGPALPPAK